MRDDDFDASLLAEGLSGIIAGPSAGLEASRAFAAAALRPAPAASVAPLLVHLKQVVHGVIAAVARGDEIELDRESENLRSLTFALASTVGTARLETTDEGDLWQLTTTLWVSLIPIHFRHTCFSFGSSHKTSCRGAEISGQIFSNFSTSMVAYMCPIFLTERKFICL